MIDFNQRIGKSKVVKKTNPIEIYDTLDRISETGPLRPSQNKLLREWFANRLNDKNIVIKLHTGEGKTLIGLLILLSNLYQKKGPCLYICPNKYLVKQTCLEAEKFGIPYCTIENRKGIPDDFHSQNSILITHVQKVFNGKTIFRIGTKYITVGCVLIDDSHSCIDSIKDSCTIKINKNDEIYSNLLELFEADLIEQGEGTYLDISNNEFDVLSKIPYWSWSDKKTEVLNFLSKNKEQNYIKFVWPLIKDNINNCDAFISGYTFEISPIIIPINKFGSYYYAKQRILMSATTQDDSFFIKGLGFTIKDILNPLTDKELKWSGEKLILIPSIISEFLDRDLIITKLSGPKNKRRYGTVSIVPKFNMAPQYEYLGALVANTDNIYDLVDDLKSKNFEKTIVLINRYDGIDLPDNSCRILIIDSMPYLGSLSDRYEEYCRSSSDIVNVKLAQKIEQGLGRSVRGEKDYSIIMIIGDDLVKFIKSPLTTKYFSKQMQKQIDIGLKVAKYAQEEINDEVDSFKVVLSTIRQVLKRDDGWKTYYLSEMNSIAGADNNTKIYEDLEVERKAEEYFIIGDVEKACEEIQVLCDKYDDNPSEKGWYLQILARYKYHLSKIESNTTQKCAFSNNYQLLKPKEGISYTKINFIDENRMNNIKKYIIRFSGYQDMMIYLHGLLSDLSFGMDSEKFERALYDIGKLLGFKSQRPDKEIRKGPDNLWCGGDNTYYLFECKSEVSQERKVINKHEAGQMNNHCGWFEKEYGDLKVFRFLIIPTKILSYHANFTHSISIIRKNKLNLFKKNIIAFFKEFKNYDIHTITSVKIEDFLNTHKLDYSSVQTLYSENYYQNHK